MVTLDELAAFVAVAETGSMTGAAERLRITQPAMTRRLKRLESDLGTALVDRRSKPVRVTAAGLEVLERARQVLQSVERVYTAGHDGARGDFRMGVGVTFASTELARPIDRVRQRFPGVAIQVITAWSPSLLARLRAGRLDSALMALPAPDPLPRGVEAVFLRDHPLVCVAPRRASLPAVVEAGAIADVRWVLNPEGCGLRRMLRQALEAHGVPLRPSVEAYGWELQLSLVARGVGFGLAPVSVVRRHPLRARLRAFRLQGHDFRLAVWLARRPDLGRLAPIADALGHELRLAVGRRPRRGGDAAPGRLAAVPAAR